MVIGGARPVFERSTVLFILVAFGLSGLLAAVVYATGRDASPYAAWGVLAMLFPAAAVLVCRAFTGEKTHVKWSRLPLRYAVGAVLLIPLIMHAAMVPVAAALEGGLSWQEWLKPAPDGLYHAPEARGWGTLTLSGLAGRIVLNAAVGLLVVSLLALWEEIGWRGWLQPRMVERLGPGYGIIVTAGIWALWHTPFALSGIHHIDGVSPAVAAAGLPIGHFGAGLIIGWYWHMTGSIWLVALAHGSLNNWGQYAFKFMDGGGSHDALVLAAGGVALVATGCVLLRSVRGRPAASPTAATQPGHGDEAQASVALPAR